MVETMVVSTSDLAGVSPKAPQHPKSARGSDARSSVDDDSVIILKSRPSRPRKQQKGRGGRTTTNPYSFLRRSLSSLLRISSQKQHEPEFRTLGGVFAKDLSKADNVGDSETSASTLNTTETTSSTDSQWTTWSSSGSPDHNIGAPRYGLSSSKLVIDQKKDTLVLSEQEVWGRLMLRARKLPKQHYLENIDFQNNHVMINNERAKRFTHALCRSRNLDSFAQGHAKDMAKSSLLFIPETTYVVEEKAVDGEEETCSRVAINVARGSSLKSIHDNMMESSLSDKNNILDKHFSYMGVGTAKAADGSLYLCQVFQS